MAEKKISFARKIKEELATIAYSPEEKKYILSGFIRNGGIFSFGKVPSLELHTEDALIAKLIYACLKDAYQLEPSIHYEKVARFGRGLVYVIHVEDKSLESVMEDLEILQDGFYRIPPKEGLHRRNLKFLLVGCFLANGSVNNPNSSKTSYFAEMAFSDKQDAMAIKHKLDTFKDERMMNFRYILRRDKHVLYLKKSDQITVYLSYLGATEAMFEFENARMVKDDMNNLNRLSICDTANFKRSVETGQKDIEAINIVLKVKHLEFFDEKSKAVIETRLKYPESNYRELAELIYENEKIQITKSGVVHILRNIRAKADEINEVK